MSGPPDCPILGSLTHADEVASAFATNPEACSREVISVFAYAVERHDLAEVNGNLLDELEVKLKEQTAQLKEQAEKLDTQAMQYWEEKATRDARIIDLETMNFNLQKNTPPPAPSHGEKRTPAFPDPEKFSGSGGAKNVTKNLTNFLQDMNLKLRFNDDWYATEQHRMGYFFSRLADTARGAVQEGLRPDGSFSYLSVAEMIQVLQQSFGILNQQADASKRILSLKQGNQLLSTFLPAWLEIKGYTNFNDEAAIAILREALHFDIITRLSYTNPSDLKTDLIGFCAQVRETDTVLRQLNPNYYKAGNTGGGASFTPNVKTTITTTTPGDPMDLSASQSKTVVWTATDVAKNRRPVGDAEKLARRNYLFAHSLCLWCASDKHRAADCPDSPWVKKAKAEATKKSEN